MIEKNTVLILGAGASKPYGFPTGQEMLTSISEGVTWRKLEQLFGQNQTDIERRDVLHKEYDNLVEKIKEPHESIDLLLSRWPTLAAVGKQAITIEILHAERQSVRKLDKQGGAHWYATLFKRLTDEVAGGDSVELLLKKNHLSIITFNYDRSLDVYLLSNLLKFVDVRDKNILLDSYKAIPIVHIYGRVADPFDKNSKSYLAYGSDYTYDDVLRFSENIDVMYSTRDGKNSAWLKQVFLQAKQAYFLGFAYHSSNIKYLEIPKRPASIDFFGTTQSVPVSKLEKLEGEWHVEMGSYGVGNAGRRYYNKHCLKDLDCAEFVNHYL